jgi:serine/threonine-protein kinase HipA
MRCLITNESWEGPGPYSPAGLRLLDRRLRSLAPLPYTRDQLLEEAAARAAKMSIQGMQPKVSTVLRVTEGRMEIVDNGGRYIVKPPHLVYAELPENEALTMSLAATLGIEVPVHGLLQNSDKTHDTKYDSSTERLIEIIDHFCTFPALERLKFLDRLLCAYLTGNEDMHLKNWSLITRDDKVELSPAYDMLNSTIPNPRNREELALPLRGKKTNVHANDFWRYLAGERLGLTSSLIEQTQARFAAACAEWPARIEASFLSAEMKRRYLTLLAERRNRLGGV